MLSHHRGNLLWRWLLPIGIIHVFVRAYIVSYSCFHNHHLCPRGEGVVVAAEVFFIGLGWRLGIFDVSSSFIKNRLFLVLRFRHYNSFISSWLFLFRLPFLFWFFRLPFDVLVTLDARYFRDCQKYNEVIQKWVQAYIYQIGFDVVHAFIDLSYNF